jgi:hypothetical protein
MFALAEILASFSSPSRRYIVLYFNPIISDSHVEEILHFLETTFLVVRARVHCLSKRFEDPLLLV